MTDGASAKEDPWRLQRLPSWALGQVAEIESLVFPEPLLLPEVEQLYALGHTCYVAFMDGRRVAAYFGFEVVGPVAHVISNATHPDYRRQGLGGQVLLQAEAYAGAMGARFFLGEVRRSNLEQQSVLHRIGWRQVSECSRFFGNGEDAILVMRVF